MSAAAPAAKPGPPATVELCLDSSVVVNLILQKPGWRAVHSVLQKPSVSGILPGPVLTEMINVSRREGNRSTGSQLHELLGAMGLRVEHPTEDDLVRAAELLEISRDNPGPPSPITQEEGTLSLADSLILAIAERLGCMVLTRDRYWKWMVDQDLLEVRVAIP
ncbi:PIN domain-containing protein [Nocardioides limicola]|uniref:PIN domain-containing protein n=1 Tax=Nocardioides limicola TaxID=2803368 RepID=UPI00193C3AB5|nr:PIN domain-containing protein [Nocardioides sp. DJM-14]